MLDTLWRINMNTLTVKRETLPEAYRYLGGRALSSRIVADEVPAVAEPLGPNNKLVFTCGLLAGTTISCANRLSVGAKSPLTGGIKESNAGGIAAYKLGRLGIRAIVAEGIREDQDWFVLVINKDGASLKPANELCGLTMSEKAEAIYRQYGRSVGVILIGPAGERKQLTAGIANNDTEGVPWRFSGRGALGAVMGAKHLLGIVLDDTGCPQPAPVSKEEYLQKTKEFHQLLLKHPQTAEVFPKFGTAAMMETTNTIGGLPTRNFRTGRFAGAENINGRALHDTIVARGGEGTPTHACMPGCLVRCSNRYPDRDGKIIVSPLEYETLGLLGANLEIGDLDVIAKLNRMCNEYGVDTIEIGCAIGIAMEAGVLPFGDGPAALSLMEEMMHDTYLGKIIAAGCVVAAKVLGVLRVPAVKGQGMPAYEPRGIKGTGVTYITTPMGADHTAGNVARAQTIHHDKEGKVALSAKSQLGMSIIDALGLCMMIVPALPNRAILAEMINALHGWQLTENDFATIGRENIRLEQEFNRGAGFTAAHDRLPEHFYEEVNPAVNAVFDINDEDLKEMKL
ncbi:MAG: aldehyde ferredoxin oxidoreductase [Negativicutes bacterium]|nr:aldehyde ferredoxin oxidoreductase [Negativicutes bacterium]